MDDEETAVPAGHRAGRLPRFRRADEQAPPCILTERDIALLEDLWRYGLLTTSQLELLRSVDERPECRFVSRFPLQRRLQRLYHHCYLNRIPRPIAKGSLEPVYVLDGEGARELSRRHGEVRARAPSQLPKEAALEHRLAIHQFRVCLEVASAREEGVELVSWKHGETVKFAAWLSERGERREKVTLIPDGFFVLKTPAQRLFYFLEVDRATEPGKTLAQKCKGYYAYWQSGGFAHDFSVPEQVGFRVLFVAPSEKRAETVVKAIETLEAGRTIFWVTTQEAIIPEQILAPLFQDGASGANRSLMG